MKSQKNNFELVHKYDVLKGSKVKSRPGEFRNLDFLNKEVDSPRFVLLGVSECIGPFANYGRLGANHAFSAFLAFFLAYPNFLQSFDILGNIEFIGPFPQDVDDAGQLVEELDAFVEQVLLEKVNQEQIPVIIGGGHNNALPIIRWASKNRNLSAAFNLDAHFDCRSIERRHSGNAFSSAILEGSLNKYKAFGVDTYAANEHIWNFITSHGVGFVPFTAYLQGNSLKDDLLNSIASEISVGLDIDLDCIENMPSSAQSPSGFSLNEVRQALLSLANSPIAYLHLCEGAPQSSSEERIVGKAICFLVTDFIRAME